MGRSADAAWPHCASILALARTFRREAARGPRLKVGFAAHLFFDLNTDMRTRDDTIWNDIDTRLAAVEPDVEVLACERIAAERLRLVIDRPGGVDLALCERVTRHLRDLLVEVGLEVSSPGPRRPLTKPDHFRRFLGRRARLRLRTRRDGQKSFTGELVSASDEDVTLAVGTGARPEEVTAPGGPEGLTPPAAQLGVVSIPYSEINRSNLVDG
jgi:ribosome maturation factor RimP